MIKKVPLGIQLISAFFVFGGLILLFTLFNIYFFTVSWFLYARTHEQLFAGNSSWSLFMLIYIYVKRKDFLSTAKAQN